MIGIRQFVLPLALLLLPVLGWAQRGGMSDADRLESLRKDAMLDAGATVEPTDAIIRDLEKAGSYCLAIDAYTLKGILFTRLGHHKRAFETLTQALRLHREHGCKDEQLIYLYRGLAEAYSSIQDDKRADSVARHAIRLWRSSWRDSVNLAQLYYLAGTHCEAPDQMIRMYDTAMMFNRSDRSSGQWLNMLINLGAAYGEMNDHKATRRHMLEALPLAWQIGNTEQRSLIYNNLAFSYEDDPEAQLPLIDSAIHYARQLQDLETIRYFTYNKAFVLSNLGRYREAYDQLLQSYAMKDTINTLERLRAVKEVEQKYLAEVRIREIQQLKLDQLQYELSALRLKRNQVGLIIGVVALLILMVFFALSYINTRRIKNKLAIKNKELDAERKLSDSLLLNILPAEVAQELKTKGESEARLYNNVTVLFADFVSFTIIGERMTPTELVAEIHRQFTHFDLIMEKHGLEKIKTIGDAYLAVCGLPDEHQDHAVRAVRAAQEIIRFTQDHGSKFKVRVGINSGPVVAGIVGVKKYAYDIWGDTVNTAARMEENSEAGQINITQHTYDLISHKFSCVHRGKVAAKHKGMVDMYFVEHELT